MVYTTFMFKNYTNKFFCFSPPVMLATFVIEFVLAIYVVWRYKMNLLTRLVTALLICLGLFQLAEFMICGGLGLNTADWSRLGYISITLLPALGLHIVSVLSGRRQPYLIGTAYGMAALSVLYFIFVPGGINIDECRPNYAIFNMDDPAVYVYTLQYYIWLTIGLCLAIQDALQRHKVASALYGMAAFYAVFMIPTSVINMIDPTTVAAIPSIMCGFAVIGAIIVVTLVLPVAKRAKLAKQRKVS